MVTRHVCTLPGCPNICDGGRCPDHRRASRAARADQQRAYGHDHQQRRARLYAAAIGTPCPDCGETLVEGGMVADHSTPLSDNPNSVADRVHCRRCSNRQGGTLARQAQP